MNNSPWFIYIPYSIISILDGKLLEGIIKLSIRTVLSLVTPPNSMWVWIQCHMLMLPLVWLCPSSLTFQFSLGFFSYLCFLREILHLNLSLNFIRKNSWSVSVNTVRHSDLSIICLLSIAIDTLITVKIKQNLQMLLSTYRESILHL